ncbi:MAG TPA: 2'-deoxycytidine 5'-triphosphate deaminase [Bryobacteraceae bacterium]|nr:2'-deoxycytidine 5'-triphosphate deaminase [Bryobacteraceae bacterium]
MRLPWSDWIPGVLSRRQVIELCQQGYLTQTQPKQSVDHSSIDLHLEEQAWVLPRGSIKPSGRSYLHFVEQHELATKLAPVDGAYVLEPRKTYLFRIRERLGPLRDSGIYGEATAKSSVGRLDVLARLVVDGTSRYEGFSPDELAQSSGDMFIEITPMTFHVRVKVGTSLSQLRLFYGDPIACEIHSRELWNTVLYHPDCDGRARVDDTLSVDLDSSIIATLQVAALEASPPKAATAIDLWKKPPNERPQPWPFWKFKNADKYQRLQLNQKSFYILRSRERLRLPLGVAAYCRAIDETIGEMRIHYAGFVHPFFGFKRADGKPGTPLIFEVRGHDLDVSLIHRERLARLTFYRMSEDAIQSDEAAPQQNEYNEQELKLSGYFGEWPEKLTITEDCSVVPSEAGNK